MRVRKRLPRAEKGPHPRAAVSDEESWFGDKQRPPGVGYAPFGIFNDSTCSIGEGGGIWVDNGVH